MQNFKANLIVDKVAAVLWLSHEANPHSKQYNVNWNERAAIKQQ